MRNWNKKQQSFEQGPEEVADAQASGNSSPRAALGGELRNWNKKQQIPVRRQKELRTQSVRKSFYKKSAGREFAELE